MDETTAFIGLDTAKNKIAVAVADGGRDGEVRFLGKIDHMPEAIRKLGTMRFCGVLGTKLGE